MSNFTFRNVKPIYRILNTETGELIEINPKIFYVRLLSEDNKFVKVKASSIFADFYKMNIKYIKKHIKYVHINKIEK